MSSKVFKTILFFVLILSFVFIAFVGFINGYDYVKSQNERMSNLQEYYLENDTSPITPETADALEIEIPRAASVDDIAKILKKNDLINNEFAFKILSKLNGFDGEYQSGTHYLTKELNYDEIMYILTHASESIMITFPEGLTYKQIQAKLIDAGLNIDVDYMDELVQRPNIFIDYSFVKNITVHEEREWLLQGYLWPDTYSFDSSMDEEDILRTFLNNTANKLNNDEYQQRADDIGLTMDEVITLASIVQAEGSNTEMYKISKVFLNRLDIDMPLASCATINYLRLENGEEPVFWVMQSDLDRFQDNPYDTYSFIGLPPGPINNPGIAAIEGVLWPATERTWDNASNYYYFCADGQGNNVFAQTEDEHQENVDYYSGINQGDE